MKKLIAAPVCLLIALLFSSTAFSLPDGAVDFLLKTAPRPAGMGGAFTAVSGDPIGMFWNPAAALSSNRFAISGNHSLRHFPGERKNLDQFDSDTTALTIPLRNDNMLGIGFTLPGEWGIDHTDTNGVLPEQERYRGRERRAAFANLQPNFNHTQAGHLESDWYRNDLSMSVAPDKKFQTGGGFSFYYETDNGMRYGVNVQGLVNVFKKDKSPTDRDAGLRVTLGAAYHEDARADTIAAVDLELHWTDSSRVQTRLFGGVERSFSKERGFLRLGSMNGMPTYGAGVRFGSARFDYAIVKNLLPKITGQDVPAFQDGHFLSYTVETN